MFPSSSIHPSIHKKTHISMFRSSVNDRLCRFNASEGASFEVQWSQGNKFLLTKHKSRCRVLAHPSGRAPLVAKTEGGSITIYCNCFTHRHHGASVPNERPHYVQSNSAPLWHPVLGAWVYKQGHATPFGALWIKSPPPSPVHSQRAMAMAQNTAPLGG